MKRLALLLLLLPQVALAEGVVSVESFFSAFTTLSGRFVQQVRDGSGRLMEQSQGLVEIQRPGKFYWQTTHPFLQEVIGDGKHIWIYDPDLEQVTVRQQADALGNTPATLLTDPGALQQQFTLQPIERAGPFEWVMLTPIAKGEGFEQLQLAMDGEILRIIQLEDSLGQRTRIELHSLMTNLSLDASRFRFTPPAGVDVVGDR